MFTGSQTESGTTPMMRSDSDAMHIIQKVFVIEDWKPIQELSGENPLSVQAITENKSVQVNVGL